MCRTDVDAEFFCHMISQWVLGEHALNSFCQKFRRILSEDMLSRGSLEPAWETAMTAIELGGHFIAGQMDFLCVDNHNVVTHIYMRGKSGPVFAAQHPSDAGCQAAQRFPFRIHEVPLFFYVYRLLHVGQHRSFRSFTIESITFPVLPVCRWPSTPILPARPRGLSCSACSRRPGLCRSDKEPEGLTRLRRWASHRLSAPRLCL